MIAVPRPDLPLQVRSRKQSVGRIAEHYHAGDALAPVAPADKVIENVSTGTYKNINRKNSLSHRLFVGIRPPSEIRNALLDLMHGVERARWQDDGQLHLTLRYIGGIETHRADDLAEAIGQIAFKPFEIAVQGTGIFEKQGRVNTLWAGVGANPALLRLQARVERACTAVGLPSETRKYHPHITLARLNAPGSELAPFLARTAGLLLGSWRCDSFILYESHLRDRGSLYEPVASYHASA